MSSKKNVNKPLSHKSLCLRRGKRFRLSKSNESSIKKTIDIADSHRLPDLSASSPDNTSDETNSSDIEEEENERDRKKCLKRIKEIDFNFEFLKKMLYRERIKEIDDKLLEIKLGTAPEYRVPSQKLHDQLNERLQVASVLKKFRMTNLQHKYESQVLSINQNYENNKEIVYDSIKADLENQLKELEESRTAAKVDSALFLSRNLTSNVRGRGRGRGRYPYGIAKYNQAPQKPVVTSGPCIVYMLKDSEILEDLTAIKKSLISLKHEEENEKNTK